MILNKKYKFFDYDAKYTPNAFTTECPPSFMGSEDVRKLREYTERAHKVLGCSGITRSDWRFDPATGRMIWLELNTTPGKH